MKQCGKMCPTCPYINEGKEVKINLNCIWKIERRISCESYNVIYMLDCDKCGKKYIGSTIRQLNHGVADHRGNILTRLPVELQELTGTCQATAWQIYESLY